MKKLQELICKIFGHKVIQRCNTNGNDYIRCGRCGKIIKFDSLYSEYAKLNKE